MKILLKIIVLSIITNISLAALPPEYQNEKDLKVMVKFIQEHEKVIATLKKLDFVGKNVYFGANCVAKFDRKHKPKPKRWVGSADPLEFKQANCEID